jgi:hypothetical protein
MGIASTVGAAEDLQGPGSWNVAAPITAIMQDDDLETLRAAVAALEHPRLAARFAEIAGKPIEPLNSALPETAPKAMAPPDPGVALSLRGNIRASGCPSSSSTTSACGRRRSDAIYPPRGSLAARRQSGPL